MHFNMWVFLRDLVENIEGFEYLQGKIDGPEVIEQIPVVKTDIYPAYSMDVASGKMHFLLHPFVTFATFAIFFVQFCTI